MPWLCLLLLASISFSCSDEEIVEEDFLPIVAVHGFLGAGDTYSFHYQRFVNAGYNHELLYTFDYNSFATDEVILEQLESFIDAVLIEQGVSQVNLMGHSKGGGISYLYLETEENAANVANYVHIGSFLNDAPAGPNAEVPTLNIWSSDDEVIDPVGEIAGAQNVEIPGADHYQVATHPDAFEAIYSFFNGEPAVINVQPTTVAIELEGKAMTFGDNDVLSGGSVEIWALEEGIRQSTEPLSSYTVAEDGSWGPFAAENGIHYEFRVKGASPTARAVHYFREPFSESDRWMVLRTIPPPLTLTGILLAGIPQDDDQAVIALFSSSQAVINGRDELMVESTDLATAELASADQSTIAYFLYDDGDQSSSGNLDPVFADFPFLQGLDLFFPTDPPATIEITFNGRSIKVPNLESASDGPVVVVFN